jgi:hypothetical protein
MKRTLEIQDEKSVDLTGNKPIRLQMTTQYINTVLYTVIPDLKGLRL